jgi:hypothetical protein
MQRFAEGCLVGLTRRVIILVISALIGVPMICGCILLITQVTAPAIADAQNSGNAPGWILAAIFVLVIFGLIGTGVLVWIGYNQRRTRVLDSVFSLLAGPGSPYMLDGRQYHTRVGERELDIYAFRGPNIEIRVSVRPQTCFTLADSGAVIPGMQRILNKTPLDLEDPLLQGMSVFTLDGDLTHAVFASKPAAEAAHQLMTLGAKWALFRQVELVPGELLLRLSKMRRLFQFELSTQEIQAWIDSLLALAGVINALPSPRVNAPSASPTRESRQKASRWLRTGVLLMIIGFPLCAVIVMILVFFLTNN